VERPKLTDEQREIAELKKKLTGIREFRKSDIKKKAVSIFSSNDRKN